MIPELVQKFGAGQNLTTEEEIRVLEDGPYCALAVWTAHPDVPARRVIQCQRLGKDSKTRWLAPIGWSCEHCRVSPKYNGVSGGMETTMRDAATLASRISTEADADRLIADLRLDMGEREAQDTLAAALAMSRMPPDKALEIAQRRGWVSR